jgi:hypothetical protein
MSADELRVYADEGILVVQGRPDAVTWLHEQIGAPQRVDNDQIAGSLVAAVSSAIGVVGTHQEVFRLTAQSADLLQQAGVAAGSGGVLHGVARAVGGQIAGHLSFERVALAPQQALSMQLAGTTLALQLAIRQVEKAVEEVRYAVDDIRREMKSRVLGDVIGVYGSVRDVFDAMVRDGVLTKTDWDTVDDACRDIRSDIAALRSYAASSIEALSHGRADALRGIADLRRPLALLAVSQETLFLWHAVKLHRMQQVEPHLLEPRLEDTRAELRSQRDTDRQLLVSIRAAIAERERARPSDVPKFLRYGAMRDAHSAALNTATLFAERRGLDGGSHGSFELTTPGDVARATAKGGQRVAGGAVALAGRLPELRPGRQPDREE